MSKSLNNDIDLIIRNCRSEPTKRGILKILKYIRDRLNNAEDFEKELISLDNEIRKYCKRKRSIKNENY